MHRIVIVCRFNAARSVLIAAAFKKLLPQLEVISCGVEALTGNEYPLVTLQTAKDWGLALTEDHSVNIKDVIGGLRHHDKVIVVEDSMKQSPYLASLDPLNIYSFGDLNLGEFQLPQDPLGYELQEFKIEIAKAVFFAASLISKFFEPIQVNSNLRLWLADELSEKTLRNVIDYCKSSSSNLLIANFITVIDLPSDFQKIIRNILQVNVQGSFFVEHKKEVLKDSFTIFQTQFESNYDSKMVFRAEFDESVNRLSSEGPLLVVCELKHPIPRLMEVQWLIASHVTLISKSIAIPIDL
jgi:protein-tyrosine-phosphatase